jgi:hypothetical protein
MNIIKCDVSSRDMARSYLIQLAVIPRYMLAINYAAGRDVMGKEKAVCSMEKLSKGLEDLRVHYSRWARQ